MTSTKNNTPNEFGVSAIGHRRIQEVKSEGPINLQVINLGLPRTGTTAISSALEILGFTPCHEGVELYRYLERREKFITFFEELNNSHAAVNNTTAQKLRHLMSGYRSSSDHPLCMCPPELVLTAYPDAKFILGTMKGGREKWWKSFNNAIGMMYRRNLLYYVYRGCISSVTSLRRTDDQTQLYMENWLREFGEIGPSLYDRHCERVKNAIPSEKLLVFNIQEGWNPLCEFLDVGLPDQTFPTINRVEKMQALWAGMLIYGVMAWSFYFGVGGTAFYVAKHPETLESMLKFSTSILHRVASYVGLI